MSYDALWLARQLQKPGYGLVREPSPPQLPAAAPASTPREAPGLDLILPYPPSVNHSYLPRDRTMVLKQVVRDYRGAVAAAVYQQYPRLTPFNGRLAITIDMHAPDRRVRDLDDIEKALLDALQHAGVYVNDGLIDDKHTRRGTLHQPPYVRVTLRLCQEEPHVS